MTTQPKVYKVDTKFGPMKIHWTDYDHMRIYNTRDSEGRDIPLVLRKIPHRVDITFSVVGDDLKWDNGRIKRCDTHFVEPTTPKCHEEIYEECKKVALQYIAPKYRTEGQFYHLAWNKEHLYDQITRLQEEIIEKQKQINELTRQMTTIGKV